MTTKTENGSYSYESSSKIKQHFAKHGKQTGLPRVLRNSSQRADFCYYCYPPYEQQSEVFEQFFAWAQGEFQASSYSGQTVALYIQAYRAVTSGGSKDEIKNNLKRLTKTLFFSIPRVDFNADIERIYRFLLQSYLNFTSKNTDSGLNLTPSELRNTPEFSLRSAPFWQQ